MTHHEQQEAARQFTALMKRVRAASARASKAGIRKVDAALADAAARFASSAAGTSVLTSSDASRLLKTLAKALAEVETAWVTAAHVAQDTILDTIVSEHKVVNFRVASVVQVGKGGVAVRLNTVPSVTKKLMNKVRKGQTIDGLVADHMSDAEAAMASYIESAVGEMPSVNAVRGIRRLLGGDLPFDLGGMTKQELRVGASIPWKAERVIVTESFEGYRQGNADALSKGVVIMVAHWETAGDTIVCPVCLKISKTDVGHGKGWYPATTWPKNPHPHCRCGQGEIRVLDER